MSHSSSRCTRVALLATCALLAASAPALARPNQADIEACASASEAAQTLRTDGKLAAAREKLLVCARPQCPRAVKHDCEAALSQLDAAQPTVVLSVKDAGGHDVVDAAVQMDGVPVASALDGHPIPLDPGTHKIHAESKVGPPLDLVIVAREGEKNRLVLLQPLPASPIPAIPPVTPMSTTVEGATPTTTPASSAIPWTVYALGGLGVASFGVFAYLDASGQSTLGDCRTNGCSASEVSSLETRRAAAWSLLGVGAVAGGAAIWIAISSASHGASASARNANSAHLAIGPGGVRGTF